MSELPTVIDARLPVSYEAAQRALAECSRVDECKDWADKAQALASYARQSKDTTLHNLALRIQSRAMRRAGELLKQVPSASQCNLVQHRQEGALPSVTRTQMAEDAGLSEHQRKTALRVASIPPPAFEAAVESATPPTVTQMAGMGTVLRPQPTVGGTEAQRLLRDLAAFCATHDPRAVARSLADPDIVRGFVASIDPWLDQFVTSLGT